MYIRTKLEKYLFQKYVHFCKSCTSCFVMERTLFLANQKTAFAQPILEWLCTGITQILV